MLFRFSLYGFLKNQKFFEPVFYLVLLNEKDLSFTLLGLLIGFGGVCVNLMEVPSGAIADLYGRRQCMIFSFMSYILSFIIFALAKHTLLLFAAMFLFSMGEAFRTGTHKAMIFDWLRFHGRESERTRIYGITRSWSKAGSAVSALIGVAFMLSWQAYSHEAEYSHVFLLCVLPYAIGIINFFGYPRELDNKKEDISIIDVFKHLRDTLNDALKIRNLRGLFIESMSFEGVFKTVKDYVQPIAYQMVLGLSIFLVFKDKDQQTTLAVYSLYFVLNLFAVFGSRFSHGLSKRMGGDDDGCRFIWRISLLLFLMLTIFLYYELLLWGLIAFIVLHIIQNLWRPMLISRFDACSRPETGATILSIESQAKSLFTIVAAPLLGFVIDYFNQGSLHKNYWPVGALGLLIVIVMIVAMSKSSSKCEYPEI